MVALLISAFQNFLPPQVNNFPVEISLPAYTFINFLQQTTFKLME